MTGRLFALALLFVLHAPAARAESAGTAHLPAGDLVIQWNQILTDTLRVPGLHPPTIRVDRSYAMLHIAIFDAVNSVERRYSPFHVEVRSSMGASTEAAAAQAAHDILSALYPAQQVIYDNALSAVLTGIPPGRARQGSRVGASVAAKILAWRSTDRWNAVPPAYVLPPLPGFWQPTPPGLTPAAFTNYPGVVPFATESGTQFLPPPPPLITSAEYAAAFNKVRDVGAANSAVRTDDQTLVAQLYAGVGTRSNPNTVWNGVARDMSRAQSLNLLDTARLFALMNAVFHDALQTSFTAKYRYGLWRPVTAIREADTDSNSATTEDDTWTSLITAPPYPTYAGNAAALSAASARALALFFGTDAIAFDVTFEGPTPGTQGPTRSYSGFWEFADEQARSRIYGGIHFTFDSDASQEMAVELVDWVFARFMVPR